MKKYKSKYQQLLHMTGEDIMHMNKNEASVWLSYAARLADNRRNETIEKFHEFGIKPGGIYSHRDYLNINRTKRSDKIISDYTTYDFYAPQDANLQTIKFKLRIARDFLQSKTSTFKGFIKVQEKAISKATHEKVSFNLEGDYEESNQLDIEETNRMWRVLDLVRSLWYLDPKNEPKYNDVLEAIRLGIIKSRKTSFSKRMKVDKNSHVGRSVQEYKEKLKVLLDEGRISQDEYYRYLNDTKILYSVEDIINEYARKSNSNKFARRFDGDGNKPSD